MRNYTVRKFDLAGRLVSRFEFAAPSDSEAQGAVKDLEQEQNLELWCGTRWLGTWAPPTSPWAMRPCG
jgi:hypothetical protein